MKGLLAAAAVAACLPAQAALSDVAGDNYSFDSSSGLYWLDPIQTVGQSYIDVAESGFAVAGWRYAAAGRAARGVFSSSPS